MFRPAFLHVTIAMLRLFATLLALFALTSSVQAKDAPLPPLGMQATPPESGPSVETPGGFMVPYSQLIPGTEVAFKMLPVPGGTFLMGSPAGEVDRDDDEGPQVKIVVSPFWIAECEVTWAEYKEFMGLYGHFKELQQLRTLASMSQETAHTLREMKLLNAQLESSTEGVDAVTCPTPLYDPEATYESGDDPRLPAVTMTPFAARQYTKWMSSITGHAYRLPSGAEWEYAARAGTTTAYHFGDDPEQLGDHEWFDGNADDRAHFVREKKPNAFGLYDMLGNVSELVLDGYDPSAYQRLAQGPVAASDAICRPAKNGERSVRGGSWIAEPEECRSASRLGTDKEEWKLSDPNLPLSPWWYSETFPAGGVGFRMVRQLTPITGELRERCWGADDDEVQSAVQTRLEEGRASQERVTADFPAVVQELRSEKTQSLLRFDEEE